MKSIIFDIETGPLPEAELLRFIDPFDPASVKVGNIKNLDLIAAKIDENREKYYADARESAALSSLTGKVLAVGVKPVGGEAEIIGHDAESYILSEFWHRFSNTPGRWVGFNIFNFDLPFMVQRSWMNQVPVPFVQKGRYWVDEFLDLRDKWQMGNRMMAGSLDAISKSFGLAGKSGDGAEFAKLWTTDKPRAAEYLKNDLALTEACYVRMCGVRE